METIKFLALAADSICAVLIIGVGVYRLALWIKTKKANKVSELQRLSLSKRPKSFVKGGLYDTGTI